MNESFEILKNKVLTEIKGTIGSEEMIFTVSNKEKYRLFHNQD